MLDAGIVYKDVHADKSCVAWATIAGDLGGLGHVSVAVVALDVVLRSELSDEFFDLRRFAKAVRRITSAPCSANARAMPNPMPLVEPVTSATLLERLHHQEALCRGGSEIARRSVGVALRRVVTEASQFGSEFVARERAGEAVPIRRCRPVMPSSKRRNALRTWAVYLGRNGRAKHTRLAFAPWHGVFLDGASDGQFHSKP